MDDRGMGNGISRNRVRGWKQDIWGNGIGGTRNGISISDILFLEG